ncbi:MAG: hypothetical protein JNL89_13570 [Rhodanobacteraceae bacterium]|nr:hypothetical protein [Rhodanobacteraceae bacterium]
MTATVALALLAGSSVAADPAPGTYINEGGFGVLEISRAADGTLGFGIEELGANAHTCSLGGEIRDGKAELATMENESCRLTFRVDKAGVHVEQNADDQERCRHFCGARAYFGGLYLRPPAGCAPAEVAATRKRFKQLYDQRKHAEAAAQLDSLLPRCERVIMDIDRGWIESDLAITRHKLGDDAGCRAALAGRTELAAMSDEEIVESYPPVEGELYGRLAGAVRTNLKLCAERAQPGG